MLIDTVFFQLHFSKHLIGCDVACCQRKLLTYCSGSSNRGEQQPCWHTTLPAKSSVLYLCGPLTLQGDGPARRAPGVSKGAIAHAMTSLQAPFFLHGSGQQRYIRPYLGMPASEGRNCLPTEYSPRYACVR